METLTVSETIAARIEVLRNAWESLKAVNDNAPAAVASECDAHQVLALIALAGFLKDSLDLGTITVGNPATRRTIDKLLQQAERITEKAGVSRA